MRSGSNSKLKRFQLLFQYQGKVKPTGEFFYAQTLEDAVLMLSGKKSKLVTAHYSEEDYWLCIVKTEEGNVYLPSCWLIREISDEA